MLLDVLDLGIDALTDAARAGDPEAELTFSDEALGGYPWSGQVSLQGPALDSAELWQAASYDGDGQGDSTQNFAIGEGEFGGFDISGLEGARDLKH